MRDRLVTWQHAGQSEEAGLKHSIGVAFESDIQRDLRRIDHEESEPLVDDLLLDRVGQTIPDCIGTVGAIKEESGAHAGEPQHILAL